MWDAWNYLPCLGKKVNYTTSWCVNGLIPYLVLTVYYFSLFHVTNFLQWMSNTTTMACLPPLKATLNLGAQAESGTAAETGLLLTTKQIGAVIFYLNIMIYLFPLITYTCHGSFLSPQTEYKDTMAAAPLLKTKVSRDSECMARKKMFCHFLLWF